MAPAQGVFLVTLDRQYLLALSLTDQPADRFAQVTSSVVKGAHCQFPMVFETAGYHLILSGILPVL